MKPKVLILTTTEPGNPFTENFSCWCADALAAKVCGTALETINLEKLIPSCSSEPLEIQNERLAALQATLSIIEKVVLILPEYSNMIPVGLDNFIELVSSVENKYKLCKLIAIVIDPSTDKHNNVYLLCRYSLDKLDMLLAATFSANRIQLKIVQLEICVHSLQNLIAIFAD